MRHATLALFLVLCALAAGCVRGHMVRDTNRDCPNCHGTGQYQCTACNGKAYLLCDTCKGQSSQARPCSSCKATGQLTDSKGRTAQCYSCDGRGTRACTRCDGKAWVKCYACDGTTIVACETFVEDPKPAKPQ